MEDSSWERTDKSVPFPILQFPWTHRRVWEAASLVLSILLPLTHKTEPCTGMDSNTSDLVLSWNQIPLFKYSKLSQCQFSMEKVHLPPRNKATLRPIGFKGKASWLLQTDFPYIKCCEKPNQEHQKSFRKPLLSHLNSVHTHRYSSTIIVQERTWYLYLVKVFIKVICVRKLTCIILPLS